MASGKLGVIGAGNMGSAIIRGLISADIYEAQNVSVYDVDLHKEEGFRKEGINVVNSVQEIAETAETIIVAVKPTIVEEVIRQLKNAPDSTLIISVAAGITTRALESALPGRPVVRVMPNAPCMIGEGASAVCRGTNAGEDHIHRAVEIMSALGYVAEVPESLMDAVTGLSGSGPAYVAVLIDALALGGLRMGLPRKTAMRLAAQTVYGTAKMILDKDMEPSALRDMVTSPGGTTAEGLMALERNAFRWTVMDAVEAATIKAQVLGE
jgi:pyrroline-5-carboxylate reductase